MYGVVYERTWGRDPDPHAEQCEWLALGLWELGVLEMGLAKEFSASGLAVIIGYL